MIPGIIGIGAAAQNPITLQFSRTDYNAGYVGSGSMTLQVKTLMPYVIAGDRMRVDALAYSPFNWSSLWDPRVAFYFTYGTSYTQYIAGGGSKNHVVGLVYSGGTSLRIEHYYTGDSTDFPQLEVSIDRLVYLDTREGASNYYEANLPA